MTPIKIAPVVLVAFFSVSPAWAYADCHQDMKDLLEGTLEVAADIEAGSEQPAEPDECTLASWNPQ